MNDFFVLILFVIAGFLMGGVYALWKTNKVVAGALLILAALAAAGGILRLV